MNNLIDYINEVDKDQFFEALEIPSILTSKKRSWNQEILGEVVPERFSVWKSAIFVENPCNEIAKQLDDQIMQKLLTFDYLNYKKPYTFKKRKPNNLVSYINQIDREEE